MALEGSLYKDFDAVAASKVDQSRSIIGECVFRSQIVSNSLLLGELRTQTVDRLWSITENLNILYRENWTRLAAEEVMEFQEGLFRALRGNTVSDGEGGHTLYYSTQAHKWSFSSSFLYSLTLITTIGELLFSKCRI